MEALRHIPLEDREAFKYALAATLVKNNAHWKAFETVFEVYFSLRGQPVPPHRRGATATRAVDELITDLLGAREGEGGGTEGLTPEQLAELLYRALMDGNDAMLRAVARAAVTRYAGMEPGRPVGGTYYLYRTLRQLDLDAVLEKMMEAARQQTRGELTELEERLAREEYEARLDALRREIEAEIRRRLVADRGAEAVAKSVRKPLPEDIDFMHASRDELIALRRAIAPLTRKLAVRSGPQAAPRPQGPARLSQHRPPLPLLRRGAGRAQVPLSPPVQAGDHGGRRHLRIGGGLCPLHPADGVRHQLPVQPGAVLRVHRRHRRGDRLLQGRRRTSAAAIHRINTEADVIWVDGHSDYGHAFETFWDRWGREVNPKTTVLLLGDARNNYHASQAWVLAEMAKKARHVYWLNPEPRSYWDTGDSIVSQYATHCDGAYECRNLKQLERFVEQLG